MMPARSEAVDLLNGEELLRAGSMVLKLQHSRFSCYSSAWFVRGTADPDEIVPAIKQAAATGKPSIINVEVDREIAV